MERMGALVEIHRVLYRGKEDLRSEGRNLGWVEQRKEVKRVIDRWYEGDASELYFPSSVSLLVLVLG